MLPRIMRSVLIRPALSAIFRPTVTGLHHVPVEGPAILATNHLSLSDAMFLSLVIDREVVYLASSELFTGRGWRGWLKAAVFREFGQVPVQRDPDGRHGAALPTGLRILTDGGLLGAFPEGARSPDGRLYRGRTGVARLAALSGAPVIPVGLRNTDRVQPIGQKMPSIEPVAVNFGPPVPLPAVTGEPDDDVLRAATDSIMTAIAALSGQEYVDMYATTRTEQLSETLKERLATARAAREQAKEQLRAGRDRIADGIRLPDGARLPVGRGRRDNTLATGLDDEDQAAKSVGDPPHQDNDEPDSGFVI